LYDMLSADGDAVLSHGHCVICVILSLAILTQYRHVTERQTVGQTHDDSKYCASMVSCGNLIQLKSSYYSNSRPTHRLSRLDGIFPGSSLVTD